MHMRSRARNMVMVVAGGLAGAFIAIPTAALAAPTSSQPTPPPPVSTTSSQQPGQVASDGEPTWDR